MKASCFVLKLIAAACQKCQIAGNTSNSIFDCCNPSLSLGYKVSSTEAPLCAVFELFWPPAEALFDKYISVSVVWWGQWASWLRSRRHLFFDIRLSLIQNTLDYGLDRTTNIFVWDLGDPGSIDGHDNDTRL